MKQISETATHTIHLDYFQGQQVRISRSKATGEIFFNTDDVAKVLGYKDHDDMMSDPEVRAQLMELELKTGRPALVTSQTTNNIN